MFVQLFQLATAESPLLPGLPGQAASGSGATGPTSTVGSSPALLPRHADVRVGAKGHTRLTARDEIKFPSLPSLRIRKEFIKRRVATFLEVLIRLQPAASSLLASVVDSNGYFCTFNHAPKI
jgi:hypothetical protein